MVVSCAAVVGLCASCSPREPGDQGLNVGATSMVVRGHVVGPPDGEVLTVSTTSVVWAVGERFNAGLGRLDPVPVPAPGEELRVRSLGFALPVDTELIMFLGYVLPGVSGDRTVDWEWAVHLVLDPNGQSPLPGTPAQTVEDLGRILYEGEDPARDTVAALIEHIQEEVERVEAHYLQGVDDPPLGPRTALLQGD